jgi:hypothetical protein
MQAPTCKILRPLKTFTESNFKLIASPVLALPASEDFFKAAMRNFPQKISSAS